MLVQLVRKHLENWFEMMSDSSTVVKQAKKDHKFNGSKQADTSAVSKKTEKNWF
jgi:hypothetical protein